MSQSAKRRINFDEKVHAAMRLRGPRWREIGAAWLHGDGEGFNLKLD
jgi:hypothetical protein